MITDYTLQTCKISFEHNILITSFTCHVKGSFFSRVIALVITIFLMHENELFWLRVSLKIKKASTLLRNITFKGIAD